MKKTLQRFLWVLLLIGGHAYAQTRTVIGTVTSKADGLALPGVSVMVKGSKTGTQTGPDGTYNIKVASGQALVFTFIGFESQTITPSNDRQNVALVGSASALNEVVVTGYGTQTRRAAVGSVASVKGASISQLPVQSFDQALAGRATGVQITIPTGVLNSPPVFRIRGTNSISLSSQPIFVIDGQVVFTGDVSLTSSAGNALSNINPNDIESIEVAKDAAATALYGSRAANGVVFVTTKKGKVGKPIVNYNGWVGFTNPYRLPDMMNAVEYTNYKNTAIANARAIRPGSVAASAVAIPGTNPTQFYPQEFRLQYDANGNVVDTDWQKVVYRQGVSQNHNVNISGANDNTSYYASFGYTNQKGIYNKNDYKRINTIFSLDSKINKVLTAGGKFTYSNEKNLAAVSSGSLNEEAYGTAGLGRTAMVTAPNVSPYNADGSYNIGTQYIGPGANYLAGNQAGFYNPVPLFDLNRSNNEINHAQGNVYAQLKPVSWVNLRSLYSIDYIDSDNDLFGNPIHGDAVSTVGSATGAFRKYARQTWTNTAQFDYTFATKHSVSLLAGQEQQFTSTRGYGINRQGLADLDFNVVQAGGYATNLSTSQIISSNYLASFFGRLNYNFDQKYFISGNIREDNYSGLGVKKGTFYGVGAKWEIARESFWTGAGLDKVFSSFQVKGSYGKVGNIAGLGSYDYLSTFGSGTYAGIPSLSFSAAGNNVLQWETSKKTDVGINFGMFGDRLTGEITYYKNDIDNLILRVPQPPSAGFPNSILQNVGTMYNKGIELTLGGVPIQTKEFNWTSNFNITLNKNLVTSLANGLTEIVTATGTTTTGENVNYTTVGKSLGYLKVVRTGGVDPQTGRRIFYNAAGRAVTYQHIVPTGGSLWNYLDNGAPATAITAADAVYYQNSIPKWVGGFDNTFRYKGFDLNVLLTYQLGFYVSYGSNATLHDQRFWNNTTDLLDYWTKPGDVKDAVRPIYGDNVSYGNTLPSDFNIFKGDFVKLKNVTLGYNLPKSIASKIKVNNARIYVSGQNLAIATKYPGPDPEVASNGTSSSGQGSDRNGGPNARTITFGVNFGF
ncbi:SusC/RagA family TonB-linked outer membrane protein [Mucilaginibacter sp. PAMB04168]|uniref:SusC/RagA family TonB-linked outer membrane protein n=1 Tax=Mucilaginibacter sp. PAMB04168 TaxID=3138567 RepID=UPI0031F6ACF3